MLDPTVMALRDVYAHALFSAMSVDDAAVAEEDMRQIVGLLDTNPDMEPMLVGMAVKGEQQMAMIQRVFGGRVHEKVLVFLLVLAKHGRSVLLRPVATKFTRLVNERLGRVEVSVTTAVEIDQAEKDRIAAAIAEALKAEPIIRYNIDGELLGGMVMRVGDRVYDSSIRGQLHKLAAQAGAKSQR